MPIPPWFEEHCSRLTANDEGLTNLNLNIRRLDRDMVEALSTALLNNTVLVVLNLTSSLQNNPDAVVPLAETVLPHHPSLQVLHLSYNRLTDVRFIGSALRTNSCLEEVYLDYGQIGAESAYYLADGLSKNKTLRVLQLNYNAVGDKGAQALATALHENDSLRRLGLERNGITEQGATALEVALRSNVTLTSVHLDRNAIPETVRRQIQLYCRANEAGRSQLLQDSLEYTEWLNILSGVKDDPDLRFFFVRLRPDLCHHHDDV
jgi:hypothetical protein